MSFHVQSVVKPRAREELIDEINAEVRNLGRMDNKFKIWQLVLELEDGAWRGGFDEGYRQGHHDGQEILHAIHE